MGFFEIELGYILVVVSSSCYRRAGVRVSASGEEVVVSFSCYVTYFIEHPQPIQML